MSQNHDGKGCDRHPAQEPPAIVELGSLVADNLRSTSRGSHRMINKSSLYRSPSEQRKRKLFSHQVAPRARSPTAKYRLLKRFQSQNDYERALATQSTAAPVIAH